MQNLLKKSSQVPIAVFLEFNRVKEMIQTWDARKVTSFLQQAVSRSNMLKLSKCKAKVKRRIPFKIQSIDAKAMDDSTIYIENFPKTMDQ
jgi:hypothetical protein